MGTVGEVEFEKSYRENADVCWGEGRLEWGDVGFVDLENGNIHAGGREDAVEKDLLSIAVAGQEVQFEPLHVEGSAGSWVAVVSYDHPEHVWTALGGVKRFAAQTADAQGGASCGVELQEGGPVQR